jgi:hypothetical protein
MNAKYTTPPSTKPVVDGKCPPAPIKKNVHRSLNLTAFNAVQKELVFDDGLGVTAAVVMGL